MQNPNKETDLNVFMKSANEALHLFKRELLYSHFHFYIFRLFSVHQKTALSKLLVVLNNITRSEMLVKNIIKLYIPYTYKLKKSVSFTVLSIYEF